jgi:hypothetical protein
MLSYAEWVKNITEMTKTVPEQIQKCRNKKKLWY